MSNLNVGGTLFGPLHNILYLCLDEWVTVHELSAMTNIQENTIQFILWDLKNVGRLAVTEGPEFRCRALTPDPPPAPPANSTARRPRARMKTKRARNPPRRAAALPPPRASKTRPL